MWKPVRYVAAIVMIVAIILCFVTAIALPGKAKILCLLFVAFQYLA